MNTFVPISPEAIRDNVFQAIGEAWMLVTAGEPTAFNTMTASWGGWGELWHRHVTFVFVRPQRYTFTFMERAAAFTLSFFPPDYREVLAYCGRVSGRDVDKVAATGLTPLVGPLDTVYFAQARLVLVCRKLYAQDLRGECFVDQAVREETYPRADYHRLYVGEIISVLERKDV